jgi:glycine/D-amino acid oxidase-like deaminating enzyme
VLRCTEAFTVQLPGQRRRFLPLYSLMIATEPLGPEVWDEIGWENRETVGDVRHLFFYAQRTPDDRLAIGGRGAPYRLGSPIDETHERNAGVAERLRATIRRHFPAAADAAITHHWGGALGVPRDWCMAVHHDRSTGLGWGGGYTGHGVAATNMVGRTLADLVLGRDSDLVSMPFVGHRSRSWEPEPLRFVASRAIVRVMGTADSAEEHLPHTARRMRLIEPFISGH